MTGFRQKQSGFLDVSFPTIAGANGNGAIIHYHPTEEPRTLLSTSEVFLCDSGAQYEDGTTDVTRTFWFGAEGGTETRASTAPQHIRAAYTAVLQAHMALDSAVFPPGTTGQQLDVLARAPLWRHGMDYKHGTGHGVGFYLNVHEGPQAISFRPAVKPQPMLAGMVTSNEPGFYADGEFGIRIENVVLCTAAQTPQAFGHSGAPYLGFEPLTRVPMCSLLVDETLLESHERRWLDAYHLSVRRAMLPVLRADLAKDELALRWMMRESEPLAGPEATLSWRRAQWMACDDNGEWLHALPAELGEMFSFA